jgi:hypothetical protein
LPLSALEGFEGLTGGNDYTGSSEWLPALQGALAGSHVPELNGDGSLLSVIQSAFGGSDSGFQQEDDNNPVMASLQAAFTGSGDQAAGSNPLLNALRKVWKAGQAQAAQGSNIQQVALQQQTSGRQALATQRSNAHSSNGVRLAHSSSMNHARAPAAGQLMLEQGSYGQQVPNLQQGGFAQQESNTAQQALLGQQGLLRQQTPNIQQALQGQQGLIGQQALLGQQGSLGQQGGIRQQASNLGQALLGQQASNAQQDTPGQQQQQQQQQYDQSQMDSYDQPPKPQPPWKHKAINRIVEGVQTSMPHDIHRIKGVLRPVKQTAKETKHSIIYDTKRAVREAKRVDNSIKGQMVDIVGDSVQRLKPQLKQTLPDKIEIIQPWADAAKSIMQQKASAVREFADQVADTDLQIGGEIEATFGQAANLTRGLGLNMTGLSSNLAQAVEGGATNFFNQTRNATGSFAQMIPQLISTTTQAAQNTFTAIAPAIGNVANQTQRLGNLAATFPREIGTDIGKTVSAGVGAVPGLITGFAAGAAGLVPQAIPWITRGVDLAANTGMSAMQATGTVMHNLVAPMAQGALQSAGSLGTNLLTNGVNQGYNEGYLAALERRAPYQNAVAEQARAAGQPAMFLPGSFAPLGQMMTITYPCPTGNFPGPVAPVPGQPPVPPPVVPGQPPGVPGVPQPAGPPSAPIGTIIGPGIPCGVPLYMVPKGAVPRQGKPLPPPLVEYPVNPQVRSWREGCALLLLVCWTRCSLPQAVSHSAVCKRYCAGLWDRPMLAVSGLAAAGNAAGAASNTRTHPNHSAASSPWPGGTNSGSTRHAARGWGCTGRSTWHTACCRDNPWCHPTWCHPRGYTSRRHTWCHTTRGYTPRCHPWCSRCRGAATYSYPITGPR